MIFSCFVSYRNSSLSCSCSKGFSWIISSTWKHYRCNYSISATWLNISLQLYTVSFSYLHKLNQAVDLNRISLCIFLSFTQVYIPFTGRTLFKILSPPDKRFFHLKTESFSISVYPFLSSPWQLQELAFVCWRKQVLSWGYVQFPFSQKMFL